MEIITIGQSNYIIEPLTLKKDIQLNSKTYHKGEQIPVDVFKKVAEHYLDKNTDVTTLPYTLYLSFAEKDLIAFAQTIDGNVEIAKLSKSSKAKTK